MRSWPRGETRAPRSASGLARSLPTLIPAWRRPAPTGPTQRNVCLDLLAAAGKSDAIARAFSQYQSADNMTDRMAAMETLAQHDRPERAQALEDFYARFSGDQLIIDKWLALQAAIPEPATLERVRTLTSHPAFSMANPNRVLALIGSFAQANHTQFNRLDGAGYDFVADTMLALTRRIHRWLRASWSRSAPGARSKRGGASVRK
jgi:aminopeptidase N